MVWNSSVDREFGYPVRRTGERVYIDDVAGGDHGVVVRVVGRG